MATTGLSPDTDADIARVTETLAMITPRWTVRILLALSDQPLRYSEIAGKVSWLQNGQLHPKIRALCNAGLVQRTEHSPRHVTYGHSDRGAALLRVLPMIVTWAEEHLEQTDRPLPAIWQIEDSLTLLTRRHAAALLWTLKLRGEASGRALAQTVMPSSDWSNVYPPLRQLVADGLVDTAGIGEPYRLSDAGNDLGTVFGALSAWAAGQSLAQAARHPLWGRPNTAPVPKKWVSNQTRLRAPMAAPAPSRASQASPLTWQHRDLFSHVTPPRSGAALPVGGPRR
ncbi:winged helix-turn-helix transcriptional regulator [Streptomyces sp. NPDC091266]|uniref:winged helix-turn-helix transcriptional regulator n=1 Tax=Streptomyces sp. NPDC091266 TaxID=3365978 RepID=UPI003821655B